MIGRNMMWTGVAAPLRGACRGYAGVTFYFHVETGALRGSYHARQQLRHGLGPADLHKPADLHNHWISTWANLAKLISNIVTMVGSTLYLVLWRPYI
jgi:hypothetical protein